MKSLKKITALITAVFALFASVPVISSAASATDAQIINAATYIIVYNEGDYTTVVRNDVGAMSIGKLGWHATNALNLLKEIAAKNPTQAQSILGAPLYSEIVTSSSWEGRIATSSEASALSVLLATSESREVQDAAAYSYISGYVQHGKSLGITEPQALVFFADYENQNGRTGAYNFYCEVMAKYGTANLSALYNASSKNSRRTRTYNFCVNVNFSDYTNGYSPNADTEAPAISDVSVTVPTASGYTVSCSVSDNKAVTEVYFAVYYKNDGADSAKWYSQAPVSGKASHTVNISDFSSRAGDYCTAIYAFDEAGNYSYAVLNVITVPENGSYAQKLSLTVSASDTYESNGKIKWSAGAFGGSGSYYYTYELYRDGKLTARRNPSDYPDYEYEVRGTGVYSVKVSVTDSVTGNTASVSSADVNIFEPIVINGVAADKQAAVLGQDIIWMTSVSGGEGSLMYSYTVYKDGEAVYSTDYSSGAAINYTPESGGVYIAAVTVTDGRMQTATQKSEKTTVIEPLSVSGVSLSSDYAVVGAVITCSAEIRGGTGVHSVMFTIYCDGEETARSEAAENTSFSFEITRAGVYTVKAEAADSDSTVASSSGGKLTADEKAHRADANCDGNVNAADARYALRCAARLDEPPEKLKYAVDINGDGVITAADARTILRIAAKLES